MSLKAKIALFMLLVAVLLVSQATAGCGRWVVRETTDYLTDPLFDGAVADSTGPNATMNAEGAINQSREANKTDAAPPVVKEGEKAADLAGKWRLVLRAETKAAMNLMDLILIQSGDRLQGYGTFAENGANIPATAMGSISKDAVLLDVKLSKQKQDYNLDLALINGGLEGSYKLYEGGRLSESGNATATRS
jgi:hypothetical protein